MSIFHVCVIVLRLQDSSVDISLVETSISRYAILTWNDSRFSVVDGKIDLTARKVIIRMISECIYQHIIPFLCRETQVIGDATPDASKLMKREGVRSVPSFHYFKNGEKVDVVNGANAEAIEAAIKKHA